MLFLKYFNIIIVVIFIYNHIKMNTVYCDSISISELWFNTEDNTPNITVESNNKSRFSVQTQESTPILLDIRERMKRKISWYLFSKKLISYSDFKKNWYPSRSVKRQIKTELKDFINHPYRYFTHKREWLLINNCKYYKDNPNGTFFVQGIGYLEARYVHHLTAKYGYVVHNDRFVYVIVKDVGEIIRKVYM